MPQELVPENLKIIKEVISVTVANTMHKAIITELRKILEQLVLQPQRRQKNMETVLVNNYTLYLTHT